MSGIQVSHEGAGVVDRTALRVNQASIIACLLIAFLANQPWIVAFVGAVMVLGTIDARFALFQRFYRDVLRPAGILRPDPAVEDPTPHRFAQGMGAGVLVIATAALFSGAPAVGWGAAIVVIALAAVNLVFGFCAGCFVFFQLQRLRQPR